MGRGLGLRSKPLTENVVGNMISTFIRIISIYHIRTHFVSLVQDTTNDSIHENKATVRATVSVQL